MTFLWFLIGVCVGVAGVLYWVNNGLSDEEKKAIDALYERMKDK